MNKRKKSIRQMRALSVVQPWATCIIHKGQNVENRNRITHIRETIAIHAPKKKDRKRFDQLKSEFGISLDLDAVPYGAIIGFADIIDVITKKQVTRKTKKWFQGKYGYVLSNIVILKKPIATKGSRGFWRLKGKPLKLCLKQLTVKEINRFIPIKSK